MADVIVRGEMADDIALLHWQGACQRAHRATRHKRVENTFEQGSSARLASLRAVTALSDR